MPSENVLLQIRSQTWHKVWFWWRQLSRVCLGIILDFCSPSRRAVPAVVLRHDYCLPSTTSLQHARGISESGRGLRQRNGAAWQNSKMKEWSLKGKEVVGGFFVDFFFFFVRQCFLPGSWMSLEFLGVTISSLTVNETLTQILLWLLAPPLAPSRWSLQRVSVFQPCC